jgi:hypothetical protein
LISTGFTSTSWRVAQDERPQKAQTIAVAGSKTFFSIAVLLGY